MICKIHSALWPCFSEQKNPTVKRVNILPSKMPIQTSPFLTKYKFVFWQRRWLETAETEKLHFGEGWAPQPD